jgi:hypothetical protein
VGHHRDVGFGGGVSEIENLIAKRLWKVFQFHLPDTPNRVARAMLKELNDNGYIIRKRRIKMKAGARK